MVNPVCHIGVENYKSWSWKVRLSGGKKRFNVLIVVPRCLPYLPVCPLSWPNKVSLSHPKASQFRAAPGTTNARKPFCTPFFVVERHPIRNRNGGEGRVESCKVKEMHEHKKGEGGLSSNTLEDQSWSITSGWPNQLNQHKLIVVISKFTHGRRKQCCQKPQRITQTTSNNIKIYKMCLK